VSTQHKDRDWAAYYIKTGSRPPRETLMFALDRFDAEPTDAARFAVDLGAGSGRDVIEMLRRGWRVLAIDAEPDAIDALNARPDLPPEADLSGNIARFENATWPECDLVNSSFALPLCAPKDFEDVWRQIVSSLRPGGRFAGQLYGERDSWVGRDGMTFHSRTQVEALLADFDVEYFVEEEDDSTTPRGEAKHWHVFHIVARRLVANA
jgi:SAM-dependent methyltransferase